MNLVKKWSLDTFITHLEAVVQAKGRRYLLSMLFVRVVEANICNREDGKMDEFNYKSFSSCSRAISYSSPRVTNLNP